MNNNILSKAFIFAAGVAIGSAVAWVYAQTKYKKLIQEKEEEVEMVREVYHLRRLSDQKTMEEQAKKAEDIITDSGYTNYSDAKKEEEKKMEDRPYVIPPEEFGENNYKLVSLFYYADGVLTNDQNKPIKDVEKLVGEESLNHFGEYEDDSVFVRNDRLKTDYEILADMRNYSESLEG